MLRRPSASRQDSTSPASSPTTSTTFAVVRALEVIGEAAKKLPASVRNRAPGIPWRSIAGMRDKLTHEYFGVNLAVVWKTVHEDLPPLRSAVERILSDIDT